jgi:DNA-binding transcriptional LysR family regulator
MALEIRHLRAFVVVAEELNFTRAAERLHIAQQGLSSSIRQLEERLGVRLFERSTRMVALTPHGEALYEHAPGILAAVERAEAATRAATGGRRVVTLGLPGAQGSDAVAALVRHFEARSPGVDVEVRYGELTDPSGGLRAGDADVALVSGSFDMTGLEVLLLSSEPCYLLMADDHPLARKPEVTLADMAAHPTFRFPTADRQHRDFWSGRAARGGEPEYVGEYYSLDGLRSALRTGLGVHLGSRLLAQDDGITFREVPGLPPIERGVAWRAGDDRREVRDLVAAAVAAHDAAAA